MFAEKGSFQIVTTDFGKQSLCKIAMPFLQILKELKGILRNFKLTNWPTDKFILESF